MRLLFIGEWPEAARLPEAHIVLTWFNPQKNAPGGTFLIFSRKKKGCHYDCSSRGLKWGDWIHSLWISRDEMSLLPCTSMYIPHPWFSQEQT
jgi:hypothetical protein